MQGKKVEGQESKNSSEGSKNVALVVPAYENLKRIVEFFALKVGLLMPIVEFLTSKIEVATTIVELLMPTIQLSISIVAIVTT